MYSGVPQNVRVLDPGSIPTLLESVKKCFSHSNSDLAEPEVRDLDVALLVEHHVVQLEVPVEHPVLVQIQQRDADLRSIKPGAERGKT